jgi:hypothetical protein
MTISALPPAPSRSSSPSTFSDDADAFVAALPTFRTEANTLLTDAQTAASSASTSASAASTSQTAAAASATSASGSATTATTQAAAAAASAATAIAAPGTNSTSTTSMTLGAGSKTITIGTAKSLVVGMWILVARTSAPSTTWEAGPITAYNSGTGSLSYTASVVSGSGTFTDWTASLTGPALQSVAQSAITGASWGSTLISTASASASAAIDFTSGIDSTYDEYELHILNAVPATDAAVPWVRMSQSATFRTSSYNYTENKTSGSTNTPAGSSSASSFVLGSGIENTAVQGGVSGVFRIYMPSNTARNKFADWRVSGYLSSGAPEISVGCGTYDTAGAGSQAAIDGLRFMFSTGNITSGDFKLYGIRKS